jgi:hypothetical protein
VFSLNIGYCLYKEDESKVTAHCVFRVKGEYVCDKVNPFQWASTSALFSPLKQCARTGGMRPLVVLDGWLGDM